MKVESNRVKVVTQWKLMKEGENAYFLHIGLRQSDHDLSFTTLAARTNV